LIALAVAAGACWGAFNVAVRIGQRTGVDPAVGSLALIAIGLTVTVAISLAAGDHYRLAELWPYALGGAIAPGASQMLVLRAVRDAGASRFALVTGLGPLISATIALVFLGEALSAGAIAGIVLVGVGSATLARERVRPADFRAIGLAFALAAVTLFAVRDNIVRWGALDFSASGTAAAVASLVGALTLVLAYALVSRGPRRVLAEAGKAAYGFAGAGVFLALASCSLYTALGHFPVSIVAPLNAMQSLWTVIFAAFLIREHEALTSRLVAATLLIVSGGIVIGATG
jgi:drug/metabolite transporter (DMT)-like permease